jgi:hypothetical protein
MITRRQTQATAPTPASARASPPRGPSPPIQVRGRPPETQRPDFPTTFAASIRAFIADVEYHSASEYVVSHFIPKFGFQKRRLYDLLCVLCALGCCEKRAVDGLQWYGRARIPSVLLKLQLDAGANSASSSLDFIIGSQHTVSITPLTVQFVLCFLALGMDTLDIRHISRYLARQSRRHKSTLCKLYQIAHILEASGIVSRTDVPGQLTIGRAFFVPVHIDCGGGDPRSASAYSIDALLNHPQPMGAMVFEVRRNDFFAVVTRRPSLEDESEPL